MGRQRMSKDERKIRCREHSYAYWKKLSQKAKIVYMAWVIPLVNDPIQLGPYKKFETCFQRRLKTVGRLIAKGNARESDIRLFGMYKKDQI